MSIKELKPLTIEELRFAMVGDDDTNFHRIIYQLLTAGGPDFGEASHYFQGNYSDRFHDRLVKFCVKNSLQHPCSTTNFLTSYLTLDLIEPGTKKINPNCINGIRFSSGLVLHAEHPSSPIYDKYQIWESELEWGRKVMNHTCDFIVDSEWRCPNAPLTIITKENVRDIITSSNAMFGYINRMKNNILKGHYHSATSEMAGMRNHARDNSSKYIDYTLIIEASNMDRNLRREAHFNNALRSMMRNA